MAKYKVLVTARSFGTADSKALELLEANDCEVKKLVEQNKILLSRYNNYKSFIGGQK